MSLTDIVIPDSVTSIGDFAFKNTNLKEVVIPDLVRDIGYSAFAYCEQIKEITFPKSVTNVGGHAFSYCEQLEKFTILGDNIYFDYEAFSGCTNLTHLICPEKIVSNLESCGYIPHVQYVTVTFDDSSLNYCYLPAKAFENSDITAEWSF